MKKILATLLLFMSIIGYSQTNGITYQAVIMNPSGEQLPGVNNTNAPLANKNICLKFSIIDNNSQSEYIETVQTTTDEYGMVNLVIGTGVQIGGYASSFSNILWNANPKSLKVDLSTTGVCSYYTEISNQPFTAVPFAMFAVNSESTATLNALQATVAANATATTSALALKEDAINKSTITSLGTSNVLFPTQNAVKTYVDSNITTVNANNTALQATVAANAIAATNAIAAVQADVNQNEADGDAADVILQNNITILQNTITSNATATTNALILKEDAANKSTTTTLGTSNVLFPTQNAVKTYVDSNITSVNANNTALQATVAANANATNEALALKEDAANKSTTTTLGTSNVLFPTQNAVKTYVDSQVSSATIPDANATTKGKIKLAGDLGGTADAPTVPALVNKENTINAGTTSQYYRGDKTWQTFDKTAVGLANVDNTTDATKPISAATQTALALKEDAINKSTDVTLADVSNTKFPTELAVKTFVTNRIANGTAANVSGIVGIANGGTGSGTQNFVDLTTNQNISGVKTFSSDIVVNGITIGKGSGQNDQNTALGSGALNSSNANGTRNTAVGALALTNYVGTSFDNNTGVGYFNMIGLTTGGGNTSVGAETMFNVASGSNNTGIGNQSLISTSGNNNVGVGTRSGDGLTTGSNNTFIGTQAKTTNVGASISNATAIGYGAEVTSSNTIQLGNTDVTNVKTSGTVSSGTVTYPNTHGTVNQVLTTNGSGALSWSTPSSGGATSVGAIDSASNANGASITANELKLAPADSTNGGIVTTGNQTFAGNKSFISDITVNGIKVGVGGTNSTAFENVNVGINSLTVNTSGHRNSAFGESSLSLNTIGNENTAYGAYSLQNNTLGSVNNALGKSALANNDEGNQNTSIGGYSLYLNTSGNRNTAIGNYSLFSNNVGSNNVAIGNDAGTNNTGSRNTFLGTQSKTTSAGAAVSNATAIGYGAEVVTDNTIQLGNTSVTNVNTSGSITANAEISSEITANLTISNANAEQYKAKVLICNPTSPITITFGNDLPLGFNCMVLQKSADANKINLAGGSGVTIKNRSNYTATAGNYAMATIVNIGGGIIVTAGDMQ
jgi:hypothetical protein